MVYITNSYRIYEMDDMGGKQNENLRTAVPFIRQITQDGKPKLEVYRPTTNPIYIHTQVRQFFLFNYVLTRLISRKKNLWQCEYVLTQFCYFGV